MKTNWNLKSAIRAATLSLALAFGMTAGQAILTPAPAQAGVIGKIGGGIKSAAKAVGSGVKKAAVTVGSAGKTVGKAAVHAGKGIKGGISGVGGLAKRGAMSAAGVIAKTPPAKAVGKVGVAIGRRL